jgi:hypothetical protein
MSENKQTLNSEEAIQDFLDILEKHKIQCEQEGKFQEAELAKQRLIELRSQESQRKKDNLRSKQLSERLEVEEAHLLEFNQFNQQWDSRQQQYFEHAQELEAKMAEKHQQELEEFRERNEASISLTAKPSTELLNHQRIQRTLAKQKE